MKLLKDKIGSIKILGMKFKIKLKFKDEKILLPLSNLKFKICLGYVYYILAKYFQVYVEVDKIGEDLVMDPEQKLPSLLVTISDLFSTLEASIGHLHATRQVCMN